MGIMDGIMSKVGGQGEGGGIASVAKLFGGGAGGAGGLQGMVSKLSQSGMGDQVQSWVGTGRNEPVTGAQVKGALDPESLRTFAQQSGTTPEEASDQLAQALPQMVDKATPQGRIPGDDQLGQSADELKQKFAS